MKTQNGVAQVVAIAVIAMNCAWGQAVQAPAAATPPALNGPIVKTEQGKVQGYVANDVAIFRGLPFAAPPVGDLRWRAPVAPAKWSGVRAGNVFGGTCADVEDCLYHRSF